MKYRFVLTRGDDAESRACTFLHVIGDDGPVGKIALPDQQLPPDALSQLAEDIAMAGEFRSSYS